MRFRSLWQPLKKVAAERGRNMKFKRCAIDFISRCCNLTFCAFHSGKNASNSVVTCLFIQQPSQNAFCMLICSCNSLLEWLIKRVFLFYLLLPLSSSYPVEGGGLPAKAKKSRSTLSNGSIRKVEAKKALSLEAAQLEIQQQHKTLTRQVAIRWDSRGL